MSTPFDRAARVRDQILKTYDPPLTGVDCPLMTSVQTSAMIALAYTFEDLFEDVPLTPAQMVAITDGVGFFKEHLETISEVSDDA